MHYEKVFKIVFGREGVNAMQSLLQVGQIGQAR